MTPRLPVPHLLAIACMTLACTSASLAQAPTMAGVLAASSAEDWRRPDPESTLYLDLPSGRVVIELNPMFAPRHVANIRTLVREGFFDGLAVVRSQDNYVAQWGDPHADNLELAKPYGSGERNLVPEFSVRLGLEQPFTRLPDGDVYAPEVGFLNGFPVARDPSREEAWLAHCYGTVGAGRGNTADSGDGSSLYAVTGHAPRHLDRNITSVGRVIDGIEHLSSLPRGTGTLGFYERPEQRVPLSRAVLAADLPEAEREPLEIMRTDTMTFVRLIESRRHRREDWFLHPTGRVELCNVPVPVRRYERDVPDDDRVDEEPEADLEAESETEA
jgi:peptidylprolyl isomerase